MTNTDQDTQPWQKRFREAAQDPANRSIFETRPPAHPSTYRTESKSDASIWQKWWDTARSIVDD